MALGFYRKAKEHNFLYKFSDAKTGKMEISNKSLAILLIAAMLVSVGGAMFTLSRLGSLTDVLGLPGITGFGTAGVINVSVMQIAILNVSQPYVDFGVGYVQTGKPGAKLLFWEGPPASYNWTSFGGSSSPFPLRINNIGNVNLSVSVISDKNALHYLGGGTNPSLIYYGYETSGSCSGTIVGQTEISEDGGLQNNTKNVCNEFQFIGGKNEILIAMVLYIPYDAPVGNKTMTLTFNVTVA
jgi:hypothetical protein